MSQEDRDIGKALIPSGLLDSVESRDRRDFIRKSAVASITGAAAIIAPKGALAKDKLSKEEQCDDGESAFYIHPALNARSPKHLFELRDQIENLIDRRTNLKLQSINRVMSIMDEILPNLTDVSIGQFNIAIAGSVGLSTCNAGHLNPQGSADPSDPDCENRTTKRSNCGYQTNDCPTEACGVQTCTGSHTCGAHTCGTVACSKRAFSAEEIVSDAGGMHQSIDEFVQVHGLVNAWKKVQMAFRHRYPLQINVQYFE